jgi:oligopeptide transport system substrate-binding protein
MKRILIVLFALTALCALNAQEFVINNGTEPASLDPHYVEGVPEHRLYLSLFEGLTINDPKTSQPIPGVAEKWSFSKDYKTVTFNLRKSVWSDGTPLTANDFVKSWVRKLDPKNAFQYADLLYAIAGAQAYNEGKAGPESVQVKAVSDYVLEVKLVNPTPHFVAMVAHYAYAVVPMQTIDKFGKDWIKPGNMVSNGPFVLKEWKPQERIVVEANPKFYGAKDVKLKRITFLPIDDVNTGYQMYKAGQADWIDTVPSELMDEIRLRKDFQVAPEYGTYYLSFNVTRKPLDDARVRKALGMSFDRKALVETVAKGGQIPATTFVPPSAGFTPPKGYGLNVEEAKKLLAAAGFPGGQGFPTMTILYNTSSNHKRIMEYIQAQWKTNLGINIELKNQDFATYLDTKNKAHDFDLGRAGWIADYLDPATFSDMFETGNSQNSGLYSSKKYDTALAKSRTQLGAARFKSLMEAENVLIMDDYAVLPIYFYVTQNMIDLTKWDGWYPNPMNVHPWKFVGPKKK